MKWRAPIFTLLLLAAAAACAQTDNTIYVRNFAGANVGAKVGAAQLTCAPATIVPCILVIDPSLAAWPSGTMPTLCSHCYLWDFRQGPPSGGSILHVISCRDAACRVSAGGRVSRSSYFGLSRCTTFTLYPAFRRRLLTSSAIITERCCPPVHPKLMVR